MVVKELDYEKLKKSLRFFIERYLPREILTPENHPVRVLERIEKLSMAKARRGLIVAIADNIEATQDFSAAEVCDADAELERIGAYTLTFLRSKLTRHRSK
jgi:hypothetical protein